MRKLFGFLVLGAALANLARGGDADPVKAKLDKAKEAFQAGREKNREYLIELMEKFEEKARKAGNVKAVDRIKTELEEYTTGQGLPSGLPATARQKLLATRSAMDKAFAGAVKEYIKQKKDDLAAEVSKEWEAFKLDFSDDPSVVRILNKTSDKYATIPKGTEPKLLQNEAAPNMAQRFRIVPAATGNWMYIQTLDGKRLLGTDKGGVRNGTELVVSEPRTGTAVATQQWGMLATPDGWGRLVNRASNKVMSVLDRSRGNGGRLVIWSNQKEEPSQEWKFD